MNMKKIIASVAVLITILIAGLAVYNVQQVNIHYKEDLERNFYEIHKELSTSIQDIESAPLESEKIISPQFEKTPALLAILIYSQTNGVEYLFAHDSRYVNTTDMTSRSIQLEKGDGYLFSDSFYVSTGDFLFVQAVYDQANFSNFRPIIRFSLSLFLIGILTASICFGSYIWIRQITRMRKKTVSDPDIDTELASEANAEHEKANVLPDDIDDDIEEPIIAHETASKHEIDTEAELLNEEGYTAEYDELYADEYAAEYVEDPQAADDTEDAEDIKSSIEIARENELMRKKLSSELERALYYNHELALFACKVNYNADDEVYTYLCESTPIEETCFKIEEDLYIIILPELSLKEAWKEVKIIMDNLREHLPALLFHCGLSIQNKRIIDSNTFLNETFQAMYKSINDSIEITAFSADPHQYRNHIRQQTTISDDSQEKDKKYYFEELAQTPTSLQAKVAFELEAEAKKHRMPILRKMSEGTTSADISLAQEDLAIPEEFLSLKETSTTAPMFEMAETTYPLADDQDSGKGNVQQIQAQNSYKG